MIGGQTPLAFRRFLKTLGHLPKMKDRFKGLNLLHKPRDQIAAGANRDAGNVINRLFGIKLGALSARPLKNIDQMALHIVQAKLKHGEKASRPRAHNDNIRFNQLDFGFSVHLIHRLPYGHAKRIKPVWLRLQGAKTPYVPEYLGGRLLAAAFKYSRKSKLRELCPK